MRFFLFILLINYKIHSQTYYQVKYDMKTFFDGPKNYESILSFSDNNSVFKYRRKPEEDIETKITDENGNLQLNLPENIVYRIYYNSKEKTLREKKIDIFSIKILLVQDSIVLPVWKLHSENKKINNFECDKATTTFKGRNYTVWYTLEYPLKYGPWKLNGLPGLIISAHDDKKEVFFEATEIKLITDKMEDEPKNLKIVSEKEYKIEKETSFGEYQSKMNSKQSNRNLNSTITKTEKGIEIE